MHAILFGTICGYLLGCINPAYLIGLLKGEDIRKTGSHNAGASNAVIVYGKKVGAVCMLFDIFKAYFIIKITAMLFPLAPLAKVCAGSACILGHMFPVFMGFRGGKGLACTGGTVLAYSAKLFFVLLLISLLIAIITDYICFVPASVAVYGPILYGLFTKDGIGQLIFTAVGLLMLSKHFRNFRRILNGTEAHFSFLWNRENEIERVQGKKGE